MSYLGSAAGICVCVLAGAAGAEPATSRQAPDTLQMRLAWEVAEGRHASADSLGVLSGIAVDRAGNVYVSDFSAAKIWVFDTDGRSQPGIGRKGEGPGEFTAPTGIAIGPDGRLYVRDITRVTKFRSDPATGRLSRYDTQFRGPANSDWSSTHATRFDAAGRLYYPAFNLVDRSARSGVFYRYTAAGERRDSIMVPAFPTAPSQSTAWVRLDASGGRMFRGLNHAPFAPLPAWDITPRGTLIIGDGKDYRVRETDSAGREVRVYRREGAPDRIPERERRDSAAALRARLDSVPVPLDRVEGMPPEVRAVRLPGVYPAFIAVYAAPDGRIWVRRWPVGGGPRTVFEVFEPDGRLRTVVVLPRAIAALPTPVLSLGGIAAVGVDAETGANVVLRFVPAQGR
jgi:sugar lactone lactonase YvrE